MKAALVLIAAAAYLTLIGCGSSGGVNASGIAIKDVQIGSRGPIQGVGISGHDIASMTNQMARDILSSGAIVGDGSGVPSVIIDSQYFSVKGSQSFNRDLISQRLLVELNRASAGRLVFVGRRHSSMLEEENDIKDASEGIPVDKRRSVGATADYRLAGTFSTLDSFQAGSGMQQRYNQLVFELVDLQTGSIIWTSLYEVERAGADDIVYR